MSTVRRYWFPVASFIISFTVLIFYFRNYTFKLPIHPLVLRLGLTFFLGLAMNGQAIRESVHRIRFQVALQSWIFFVYPFLILLFCFLLSTLAEGIGFQKLLNRSTYLSILGVAVLPTTVTSCVVFTQHCGGNAALSLVGSIISNFLGVVLSPFCFMLFSGQVARFVFILPMLGRIMLTVILPLLCGQVLRYLLFSSKLIQREKSTRVFSVLCSVFVLLNMISAVGHLQRGIPFVDLAVKFVLFAVAYILMLGTTLFILFRSGLPRNDRIAFILTSTQKTLSFGLPLITIFFDTEPQIYAYSLIILLALMQWQFSIAGGIMLWYQRVPGKVGQ